MRVLLDESVPKALGFSIQGHFVRTVQVAGFAGMFNGELLAAMLPGRNSLTSNGLIAEMHGFFVNAWPARGLGMLTRNKIIESSFHNEK